MVRGKKELPEGGLIGRLGLTLSLSDIVTLGGLVVLIVQFGVNPLSDRMGSLEERVKSLEDKVSVIQQDIAAIKTVLTLGNADSDGGPGGPPPPEGASLNVGVLPDNAPFSVFDKATGEWRGVDIDIARTLATRAGFSQVEFVSIAELSGAPSEYRWIVADFRDLPVEGLLDKGWQGIPFDPYWDAEVPQHGLVTAPSVSTPGWLTETLTAVTGISPSQWRAWADKLDSP